MSMGAPTWLETVWSYMWKLFIIQSFSEWKLNKNQNWKLHWNLGAFRGVVESPQWVKFNRVYFTIFRAKLWKIWVF
jgi:hypothetical protein